jgi:hypothetical protein
MSVAVFRQGVSLITQDTTLFLAIVLQCLLVLYFDSSKLSSQSLSYFLLGLLVILLLVTFFRPPANILIPTLRHPFPITPLPHTVRVAIIGGGIGGVAASWFISTDINNSESQKGVQVHVFEDKVIGGRIQSIQCEGGTYEAGASIGHRRNRYMLAFTGVLGEKY